LFEPLHTLLESLILLPQLVIERSEKRAGFPQLLSDIGLVLGISAFYESCKAFGHEPNLMAESLDQYPGVSLDLLKPFIDALVDLLKPLIHRLKPPIMGIEPTLNPIEPTLNPIEPLFHAIEPLIDPIKALVDSPKALIKILNKFLIHAASAATEG
jgi:hypothetical protein